MRTHVRLIAAALFPFAYAQSLTNREIGTECYSIHQAPCLQKLRQNGRASLPLRANGQIVFAKPKCWLRWLLRAKRRALSTPRRSRNFADAWSLTAAMVYLSLLRRAR